MGIQNRDYYRKGTSAGALADWGLYQLTPIVKFLIIANVVVFVLQVVIVREVRLSPLEIMRRNDATLDRELTEAGDDPKAIEKVKKRHHLDRYDEEELTAPMARGQKISVVQEWCELDTRKVMRGEVWRMVTHAFCHERLGIWHIFFNMLFLYWFGCTLEAMYGSLEFLLFYLSAAVIAGLAFVGVNLLTDSMAAGIGASGAVLAVTMLYALHFPRETICIFWFFPIEMRWLMILYIIWDLHPLLLALGGEPNFTGIAHSAHLGGLIFGFLYGWREWRLAPLVSWLPGMRQREVVPVRRRQPGDRGLPPHDPELARMDDLLRKISESGQESLTDDERECLRRASERLKNRRG